MIDLIDKPARPQLSKEQYEKLKKSIGTGLDSLERNSGKKLAKKQRLLAEHCMLAGAVAALDTLGYDAPAVFGIAIMSGRSALEGL